MSFKKLRLWVVYPFAALYFFFIYKFGITFNWGIGVILLGLLIRFWASGYIRKIRILTTNGPYAYIRNPLYTGNFLLGLGFCVFVNNIFLPLIYVVLFMIFYTKTVEKEEEKLAELFKEEYLAYKKAVPAFFPEIKSYELKKQISYSLKQVHYNGEFIRILVTGILLCAVGAFGVSFGSVGNKILVYKFLFFIAVQTSFLMLIIMHRRNFLKTEQEKENKS